MGLAAFEEAAPSFELAGELALPGITICSSAERLLLALPCC
jgi:hypothetical protein